MNLASLATESPNPRSADLDTLSPLEVVTTMNAEDQTVAAEVANSLSQIAAAVELIVERRRRGGRLIYLGAGTSGRLGLLDAVEVPPTFGTDPSEVLGVIAGGKQAFLKAVEGAEDDTQRGREDLQALELQPIDVVVGLAASGRTPYVIGALAYAHSVGAGTVAVACNTGSAISRGVDVAIEINTGPEVLTGSTRLKAGTAQKMVCNMLSTASMVQTGKVYGNLMVDVMPTNVKLVDRATRIVSTAAKVDLAAARVALGAAGGHAKTAIVMLLSQSSVEEARNRLSAHDGHVREAVASPQPPAS